MKNRIVLFLCFVFFGAPATLGCRQATLKGDDVVTASRDATLQTMTDAECRSFCDETKCPEDSFCESSLSCPDDDDGVCRCQLKCRESNPRPRRETQDSDEPVVMVEVVPSNPISMDLSNSENSDESSENNQKRTAEKVSILDYNQPL